MTDFKEYASKEYVGETILQVLEETASGSGAHIGTEPPEDDKILLWVDTNSNGTVEAALGVSF